MIRLIPLVIVFPLVCWGQNPDIPLPSGFKNQVRDTTPPFVVLLKFSAFVFDKTAKKTTLTPKEITTIRRLLKQKLKDQGTDGIEFDKYKMQLIPSINKSGAKVVFVNAFCIIPSNWLEEFILVKDGGKCYYQATINLPRRRFLSFSFNGEA